MLIVVCIGSGTYGEAKETRKAMAFTRRRIKLSEDETLGGTRIIQNFSVLSGGRGGQTFRLASHSLGAHGR